LKSAFKTRKLGIKADSHSERIDDMARKKVVTREETILDSDDQEARASQENEETTTQLSPAEVEQIDAIEYLLSLGGDDGTRYRVDKLSTKPGERTAFCNNYSRESLSLDAIRETFGGGTYRITAYGQGSRYAGSKTVTIADLPKPPQSPGGVAGLDLAAFARELRANPSDGTQTVMPMMLEMMRQNAELLRAIITRPEPKVPPAPTTLEILQLVKEMNSAAPKSTEGSAVELLLKGIELGKEFTGVGGEDSILGLGGKAIDMLKPLIEKQAVAAPTRVQPERIALPQSSPAVPVQSPTQEVDPMLRQLNWLRTQTAALCQKAAQGKDPELYAEVLLDNLPVFITPDEIYRRLSEPNAVDQLAQLNPTVLNHRAWFESFRASILEFLKPEEPTQLGSGEDDSSIES
jgi:hypothetical protein